MEKIAKESKDVVAKSPENVAKLSKKVSKQPIEDVVDTPKEEKVSGEPKKEIGELLAEKPKTVRKSTQKAEPKQLLQTEVGKTLLFGKMVRKSTPTKETKTRASKGTKLSPDQVDALNKEYSKLAYVKLKKVLKDKKLNPANREIASNIFDTYSFNGSRLKVGDKVISMYGKRLRNSVVEAILPASSDVKRIKLKGIQKPFDARHIIK